MSAAVNYHDVAVTSPPKPGPRPGRSPATSPAGTPVLRWSSGGPLHAVATVRERDDRPKPTKPARPSQWTGPASTPPALTVVPNDATASGEAQVAPSKRHPVVRAPEHPDPNVRRITVPELAPAQPMLDETTEFELVPVLDITSSEAGLKALFGLADEVTILQVVLPFVGEHKDNSFIIFLLDHAQDYKERIELELFGANAGIVGRQLERVGYHVDYPLKPGL